MNLLDRRFLNISLTVQGIANEPAANPTAGIQYIVGSNPAGVFANASANSIAKFDGSTWKFSIPTSGSLEVFNAANGEILSFNGSAWVTILTLYKPIAPVLAIVPSGTTLPASASAGDSFLKTDDAKLYIATDSNTWDAGTLTSNGSRYASSTDHKIYSSDGAVLSSSNILNGDLFLNKEDGGAYVFDAASSAFVRINSSVTSSADTVTEIHNITAEEVTAKSFQLSNSVANGKENNILLFVSGIAQAVGTDFAVSGRAISWDNKGLDNVGLVEGDMFIIHYAKA